MVASNFLGLICILILFSNILFGQEVKEVNFVWSLNGSISRSYSSVSISCPKDSLDILCQYRPGSIFIKSEDYKTLKHCGSISLKLEINPNPLYATGDYLILEIDSSWLSTRYIVLEVYSTNKIPKDVYRYISKPIRKQRKKYKYFYLINAAFNSGDLLYGQDFFRKTE